MKRTIVASTSVLVAAPLFLTGCIASIGNRSPERPAATGTTLGQELLDLQKARDAGAITEAQYETQKARLLGEEQEDD